MKAASCRGSLSQPMVGEQKLVMQWKRNVHKVSHPIAPMLLDVCSCRSGKYGCHDCMMSEAIPGEPLNQHIVIKVETMTVIDTIFSHLAVVDVYMSITIIGMPQNTNASWMRSSIMHIAVATHNATLPFAYRSCPNIASIPISISSCMKSLRMIHMTNPMNTGARIIHQFHRCLRNCHMKKPSTAA